MPKLRGRGRSKFRPRSTLRAAARGLVRCTIDGCGAEVPSHRATLHAWEAHRRAIPAGDLRLFENVEAAA